MKAISRRDFLKAGGLALVGTAGAVALNPQKAQASHAGHPAIQMGHGDDPLPGTVGEVDHEKNGFNPTNILTDFDYGKVTTLPNGQTLREDRIISLNKNIE